MARIENKLISFPLEILDINGQKIVDSIALGDTGAGGKFIDQNYAKKQRLPMTKLDEPIEAFNVDGTKNKRGTIKFCIDLNIRINNRTTCERLYVTGLGKQKIILGFPWFKENNPDIDWRTGKFSWKDENISTVKRRSFKRANLKQETSTPKTSFIEEVDEEEWKNGTQNIITDTTETDNLTTFIQEIETENLWINVKTTTSQQLHMKHDEKKSEQMAEELVPLEFHNFLDVFDEKKADQFLDSRKWDHKIEMKEGFCYELLLFLPFLYLILISSYLITSCDLIP